MNPHPHRPETLAIMASGVGSNLRAIIAACRNRQLSLHPTVVLSDQPDSPALTYARKERIPVIALPVRNYADRGAWEQALSEHLASFAPDLIALAGFMRVLSPLCVARFAGRMVNIHPSLLPLYPGLHPHRQALEAGASAHGATVHLVTETVDGGPRIAQILVPIRMGDDESSLIERTKSAEHRLYPEVLEWIARGHIVLTPDAIFQNGVKLTEPIIVDAMS
ncbi:MAG: phosphoribosylglycinamide formyltransferase [Gammaproteobacteria bacterium]